MLDRINRFEKSDIIKNEKIVIEELKKRVSRINTIDKLMIDKERHSILFDNKYGIYGIIYIFNHIINNDGSFANYIINLSNSPDDYIGKISKLIKERVTNENFSTFTNEILPLFSKGYPNNGLSKELIKRNGIKMTYSKYQINILMFDGIVNELYQIIDEKNIDEETLLNFHSLFSSVLMKKKKEKTYENMALQLSYEISSYNEASKIVDNLNKYDELIKRMINGEYLDLPILNVTTIFIKSKFLHNKSYIRIFLKDLKYNIDLLNIELVNGKDHIINKKIEILIHILNTHYRKINLILNENKFTDFDYFREAGLIEEFDIIDSFDDDFANELENLQESVSRAVTNKAKEIARKLNVLKYKENKFWDKIEGIEKNIRTDYKDAKEEEYNEKVVDQVFNLTKFVRKLSLYSLGFLFPATRLITLIALITKIATNEKTKKEARLRILHELEAELRIVKEKISDASSDDNKEAKYKLMRIENELIKNIEKVKVSNSKGYYRKSSSIH